VQTRRDLLQAYRFQTRRAVAALVTGQPNVVEPPMRRLTVTTISGIMIAILVAVGFALFGFFKPGSTDSWRAPGSIIVENETGARYVLLGGALHPVLNYTSAVLAVGNRNPHVVHVARSDLDGVPRGIPIGIPHAPDSLPAPGDLVGSPWTVCSRQQPVGGSGAAARVTVRVGSTGGARLLPTDTAVIATPPGGAPAFLLADGRRYAITSARVATALNVVPGTTVVVGRAFLDAVPVGPALRPPTLPGQGAVASYRVAGGPVRVGQLLQTGGGRHFLALRDGVSEVNDLQFALLQAVPLRTGGRTAAPVRTNLSAVLPLPHSQHDWSRVQQQFAGLPATVPPYSTAPVSAGGLCAVFRSGAEVPELAVPASMLAAQQPVTGITESPASAAGHADAVLLRPGAGALVRASGATRTVYVVVGTDRRYPAAAAQTLAGFGYGVVRPTRLPEQVISLVPAGPALDPAAARRPYGS
jgi:type VII secretion protein EccB